MNIRQLLSYVGGFTCIIALMISASCLMYKILKSSSEITHQTEELDAASQNGDRGDVAVQNIEEWTQGGLLNLASNAFRKILKIKNAPIEPISVRQGTDFCPEEIAAVKKRRALKVKPALEALLGKPMHDDTMPNIGIVLSGGGDQAMIAALGFLIGLEKIGILDACSYLTALSGSTWTLSSWLARNVSLSQLDQCMQKHEVTNQMKVAHINFDAIAHALIKKFSNYQRISFCDLWGEFLAGSFFKDLPEKKREIHFSQFRDQMESGDYPFSLCTAVIGKTSPYEWLEFSPFEVGSEYLKAWIPTFAFGKYFTNGQTTDPAPEPSINFMMGMFGAAYAVNVKDLLRFALPPIKVSIENKLSETNIPAKLVAPAVKAIFREMDDFLSVTKKHGVVDDARFSPPSIFNFVKGLKGVPFSKNRFMTIVDAGMASNLPFPPLMRRNVNLYIAADVSGEVIGAPLKKAEEYARRKGYKFPVVDLKKLKQDKVSLLYDPNDPEVPVVIHIPNREAISIFTFEFTQKEYDTLRNYMHSTVVEARDTIINAVRIAIRNLKKLKSLKEL